MHEMEGEEGRFATHKIKNEIGQPYGEKGALQLALLNVWQLQPSKFLLVCNTQKTALCLKNK